MRSAAIFTALLAAGVLAQPLEEKRDVVIETQVNVVYTTVVVDGSGQQIPAATPAPTPAPPAPEVAIPDTHDMHHRHQVPKQPKPAPAPAPVAPAPAPAPAAPKVAPAPPVLAATSYSGVGIQQHNLHRQNHSAPDVTWDSNLAQSAATLAAGCEFRHDVTVGPASNYGQNIASSWPALGSMANELKQVITNMWYNGEVDFFQNLYGQNSPDMTNFDSWGHFSQIVWKGSTTIGCATQTCPGMGYFTVCNYGPAGNMIGDFAHNVHRSIGEPTVEA